MGTNADCPLVKNMTRDYEGGITSQGTMGANQGGVRTLRNKWDALMDKRDVWIRIQRKTDVRERMTKSKKKKKKREGMF